MRDRPGRSSTVEFDHWAKFSGLLPDEASISSRRISSLGAATLEAGAGGGRGLLLALPEFGFTNLTGFDFVPRLIDAAQAQGCAGRSISASRDGSLARSTRTAAFAQVVYLQQVLCFIDSGRGARARRGARGVWPWDPAVRPSSRSSPTRPAGVRSVCLRSCRTCEAFVSSHEARAPAAVAALASACLESSTPPACSTARPCNLLLRRSIETCFAEAEGFAVSAAAWGEEGSGARRGSPWHATGLAQTTPNGMIMLVCEEGALGPGRSSRVTRPRWSARYRARSLWLDGLPGAARAAPAAARRRRGATSRSSARASPACGRPTTWRRCSPTCASRWSSARSRASGLRAATAAGCRPASRPTPRVYARAHGEEAVRRGRAGDVPTVSTRSGAWSPTEGIDCGYRKGGQLMVATSRAAARAPARLASRKRRALGLGRRRPRLLEPRRGRARACAWGARWAASFSPHCARVDPARLARGLAEAVERRGVTIYERTPAVAIEPGRVADAARASARRHVVRATEAFTVAAARRAPPLPAAVLADGRDRAAAAGGVGRARLGGGETVADLRHLFFYAQRTTDDRLAIGGRGAPYRLGSPIDEANERNDAVRARLVATIRRHFARPPRRAHHAPLGRAARRAARLVQPVRARPAPPASAGAAATPATACWPPTCRAARWPTWCCGADTELTTLPWVGHEARRWEPEPLRFVASRADRGDHGQRRPRRGPHGRRARRTLLVKPFMQVR